MDLRTAKAAVARVEANGFVNNDDSNDIANILWDFLPTRFGNLRQPKGTSLGAWMKYDDKVAALRNLRDRAKALR